MFDQEIDYDKWYPNYLRTYVERDVRQLKNITSLIIFEKFLRLCAGRIGQLLNMSNIALETGVDSKTISAWLTVLESSFIIFRLFPYHRNFNKRIVKMPKLYFYDTGLACSLLGINKQDQLNMHPLFGSIFENLIVSELKKQCSNRAGNENLFFWRDNTGHEIDIILEKFDELFPVEIKSGKTITNEFFNGLNYWKSLSGIHKGTVVYAGDQLQIYSSNNKVVPWFKLQALFHD